MLDRTSQPRLAASTEASPSSATIAPTRPSGRSARAGNVINAACTTCRKHKAKCSGERPACRHCVEGGHQCRYITRPGETRSQALRRNHDTWRGRAAAQEEAFFLLRTLPEGEAQIFLAGLRSGREIEDLLRHRRTGDPGADLAVTPETRFRYQLPYRPEMPQEYIHDNPYLKSLLYEAASVLPGSQNDELGSSTSAIAGDDVPYTKPFHAAHVIDPLLTDASPSAWTTVCRDDALMRALLHHFFLCEYSFTSAFHKDLFLADMAQLRHDFCSPMLVNIVLAYACACFPGFNDRAEYWNPKTLMYRFLAEAKRLWELHATEPRITTVQAGVIFNVIHNFCGLDEIGQAYRINAISLANKLRLFDGPVHEADQRIRQGKIFTAWALFSWEALVAFSFVQLPLLQSPPHDTLPDPSADSGWYGEVWLLYPSKQAPSPSYFGHLFKTKARFRVIMASICDRAYSRRGSVSLSVVEAYDYYAQLIDWYNTLPDVFSAQRIVLPAHLQLHIYYHHLILTVFEPLLQFQSSQEPTPQQVVKHASVQLLTLIRLYYLRHGYEAMDLFIVIPLMLAGLKCLDAINEHPAPDELETHRSTLLLVANGLYYQRRNHYLAEVLYKVIRSKMRPQEALLLKSTTDLPKEEDEEDRGLRQAVRSHWPVSVVRNKEELDSHILANLVETLTVNDKS